MKHKARKLLSILLALVMVAGLLPLGQVAQAASDYNISVKGVAVTDANADNVLGDGTVRYDESTKTLTLEDADITFTKADYDLNPIRGIIDIGMRGVTIELIGNNSITSPGDFNFASPIYCRNYGVTIKGSGNLTLRSNAPCIRAEENSDPDQNNGDIKIDGAKLELYFEHPHGDAAVWGKTITLVNRANVKVDATFNGVVTFDSGGDVVVDNSELTVVSKNDALSGSRGLYASGDINIRNGAVFDVKSYGTAFYANAGEIMIDGANTRVTATTAFWGGATTFAKNISVTGGAKLSVKHTGAFYALYATHHPTPGNIMISGQGTEVEVTTSGTNAAYDGGEYNKAPGNALYCSNGSLTVKDGAKLTATNSSSYGYNAILSSGAVTVEDAELKASSVSGLGVYALDTFTAKNSVLDIENTGGSSFGLYAIGDIAIAGGKADFRTVEYYALFTDGELKVTDGADVRANANGIYAAVGAKGDITINASAVEAAAPNAIAIYSLSENIKVVPTKYVQMKVDVGDAAPGSAINGSPFTAESTLNADDIRCKYVHIYGKQKLTVTAIDQTYTYNGWIQGEGDTIYAAPAQIAQKVQVDGLKDGDYIYLVELFGQGTDAGEYEVAVNRCVVRNSATNDNVTENYDIELVDGKMTIEPATLTVTTGSDSKIYDGSPLTAAEATIEGFVRNDTATVTATGSQTDVGTSDNTYTIDWDTAKESNYKIDAKLGTLTVEPKPVTVTANDASKTYGQANPTLTATVTGLVGSDTVNYSISREPGENTGTYTITPAGEAAQGNYTVSFASGTFTIEKAPLTLGLSIEGWTTGQYDAQKNTPVLTGNTGNGAVTYEYKLTAADEAAYGTTVPTAAGDYTVRATVAETTNYKSGTAAAEFTIRQRQSGGGGGVSTYAITIEKPENGSLTASRTTAPGGTKITLTATPDEGFEADTVKVTDRSGKEIAVTKNDDGTYTFAMPGSKVNVTATFKAVNPNTGAHDCPSAHLKDVDENAWYHEYVDYVVEKGLMQGVADDLFAPNVTTSRAMIVTILYRLEGRPAVSGASPFDDVAGGQWYTDAIIWANSEGIVQGYGGGRFGTDDNITREQFAAILYRYAKFKGYDVSAGQDTNILSYDDAFEVSDWAMEAMQWAVGSGLITGRTETTLVPRGDATRAEAAAILMRFCENVR